LATTSSGAASMADRDLQTWLAPVHEQAQQAVLQPGHHDARGPRRLVHLAQAQLPLQVHHGHDAAAQVDHALDEARASAGPA
jgi:hypothetical protein